MSNFANREVANCIFEDYATKNIVLNCDYANVVTTELSGESVFAYGGAGHPKRIQFNGEKGGTITIETQLQSFQLWQLMTGGDVTTSAKYMMREVLPATTNSLTLSKTPSAGATVNVFADGDDCGTPLKVTVSETSVTLPTGSTGKFIVYYLYDIADGVQKLNIKGSSFPKAFTLYGDTVMKTEDDELLPYRFIAYKCACQSNMSLSCSNSGDPVSVSLVADLMTDNDNNMLDLILEA